MLNTSFLSSAVIFLAFHPRLSRSFFIPPRAYMDTKIIENDIKLLSVELRKEKRENH